MPAPLQLHREDPFVRGPHTPLAEIIESFLLAQVDLSPRTLEGYRFYLTEYDRITGHATLGDMLPDAVNRYIVDRKPRGVYAARYAAATLKAFASWCAQSGYAIAPLGGSVLASVKIPRVPKGGRRPYGDAELAIIFRTLGEISNRTRARDRAVVLLLLATGIRLNEARELALEDVHINRPIEKSYIVVRWTTSKGKEFREVRLDPVAAQAIHAYTGDWRPARPGPLLLTEEGAPFTYRGFSNYMGRLGDRFEAAGVSKWMTHRNRHTWATLFHRMNSGTLYDLQREGGWLDLEMPRRYTQDRPFEELQRIPTALTSFLKRDAQAQVRRAS